MYFSRRRDELCHVMAGEEAEASAFRLKPEATSLPYRGGEATAAVTG
jgi:hypothetical protein